MLDGRLGAGDQPNTANTPASRTLLIRAAPILLAAAAAAGLFVQLAVIAGPEVYEKDFKQEYLLARAVLDGINPYLEQAQLAALYLQAAAPHVQPHPVPHPPLVALLALPLGFLPYRAAAFGWLAFELGLLLILCRLLSLGRSDEAFGGAKGAWGNASPFRRVAWFLAVVAVLLMWPPLAAELRFGQLSLLMAVLLAAWAIALRRGRERWAGILLGLAAGIKLVPIFLVGYLLWRRRWRAAIWAVATFAASFAIVLPVIGVAGMKSFLLAGLPGAASWRSDEGNYSAFSLGWRLFAGNGSLQPLASLSWAALPAAATVGVAICVWVARGLAAKRDQEVELAIAMAAMVVLSPVVWQYYMVLLVWPLWIMAVRLRARRWEPAGTATFAVAVLLLSVPPTAMALAARLLNGPLSTGAGPAPFLAAVPFLLLPLGPLLLLKCLLREVRVDVRPSN